MKNKFIFLCSAFILFSGCHSPFYLKTYGTSRQFQETSSKLADFVEEIYRKDGEITQIQELEHKGIFYDIFYGKYKEQKINTKIAYKKYAEKRNHNSSKNTADIIVFTLAGRDPYRKEFLGKIFESFYFDMYQNYNKGKISYNEFLNSVEELERYLRIELRQDTQQLCQQIKGKASPPVFAVSSPQKTSLPSSPQKTSLPSPPEKTSLPPFVSFPPTSTSAFPPSVPPLPSPRSPSFSTPSLKEKPKEAPVKPEERFEKEGWELKLTNNEIFVFLSNNKLQSSLLKEAFASKKINLTINSSSQEILTKESGEFELSLPTLRSLSQDKHFSFSILQDKKQVFEGKISEEVLSLLLNRILWNAYQKGDHQKIQKEEIDFLSHSSNPNYLHTVAVYFALKDEQKKAEEWAKKALPETTLQIFFISKKYSPKQIEFVLKDSLLAKKALNTSELEKFQKEYEQISSISECENFLNSYSDISHFYTQQIRMKKQTLIHNEVNQIKENIKKEMVRTLENSLESLAKKLLGDIHGITGYEGYGIKKVNFYSYSQIESFEIHIYWKGLIFIFNDSTHTSSFRIYLDKNGEITKTQRLYCSSSIPCKSYTVVAAFLLDEAAKEYGYNTKKTFTSLALEDFTYHHFESFGFSSNDSKFLSLLFKNIYKESSFSDAAKDIGIGLSLEKLKKDYPQLAENVEKALTLKEIIEAFEKE
jgi:hypothetical protein